MSDIYFWAIIIFFVPLLAGILKGVDEMLKELKKIREILEKWSEKK